MVHPMIRIRKLCKRYKDNDVLSGLDLETNENEILVILGRSGVGKSVLLRHIIGIEKPDAGSIEIGDLQISQLKKRELFHAIRSIGMLFQGSALFDSMTIEENTAFYLRQHGHPHTKKPFTEQEIRDQVDEALKKVGLDGTQKKMPSDLSGGMRKRAGLARLLVYRPSILLYDEPTTGLDPITAQQIADLILQTQNELKGTSIIVTHDIALALRIASRLALLRDGKIAFIAEPKKFMQIDDPMINFLRDSLFNRFPKQETL
jgi:phospholipid/cholesterol/gamma-HCH transport system ATP-binding protein